MGRRGVLLTAGPLLVALGAWPLFFVYAFASMVPPELEGCEYWGLVLSRMFDFADAGWITLLSSIAVILGCGLFLWGSWTLAAGRTDGRRWRSSPMDNSDGHDRSENAWR